MASVRFVGAGRRYPGTDRPAVDALDLEVHDGEFMVLVGPSGCGKSTSLRMLAGLEECTEGSIMIGDRDVTGDVPKDRDIAMVFQNYALYPHMTVAENMGFALKVARVGKEERTVRVREAARLLDLEDYLDRKPKALSGGQRQRVAMGRAIVRQPAVFLMDEPLSNLDAKLRVSTRTQIAALQQRLGVTTVYVTHDQTEAMTMGDRVAVLKDGLLQQVDTPARALRPARQPLRRRLHRLPRDEPDPRDGGVGRGHDRQLPRWHSSTAWRRGPAHPSPSAYAPTPGGSARRTRTGWPSRSPCSRSSAPTPTSTPSPTSRRCQRRSASASYASRGVRSCRRASRCTWSSIPPTSTSSTPRPGSDSAPDGVSPRRAAYARAG